MIFQEPAFNWPLLTVLLAEAARNGGTLRVLDFGGSLGSTYMQHRAWLEDVPTLHWGVVEQKHFVECGREQFQDQRLRYYESMDECVEAFGVDVVILSSVLQYLSDPWAVLDEVVSTGARTIFIDRTGFVRSGGERVTVQSINARIYEASYPCRFFKKEDLVHALVPPYRLVSELPSVDRDTLFAVFLGLVFRRDGSSHERRQPERVVTP